MKNISEELQKIARRCFARERSDHTLQPTALVNECFLQIAGNSLPPLQDRNHFFALAATIMRRILVQHARERNAMKRGGGDCHLTLEDDLAGDSKADNLLDVLTPDRDDALL